MNSLFDADEAAPRSSGAGALARPLAARLRPRSLDELVGQEHLLAEGSALREAIAQGRPHSMILYGPPGSGKTTLARIIAAAAHAALEELSAVEAGRPEVRKVLERAQHRRQLAEPTVFFLDEIHRFNKAQQDALLPAVEEGLVTLIGATTENPYFEVNSALLSRSQIYELAEIVRRGAAALEVEVPDEVVQLVARRAGGDARNAYNILELATQTAAAEDVALTAEHVEDAARKRPLVYDKG